MPAKTEARALAAGLLIVVLLASMPFPISSQSGPAGASSILPEDDFSPGWKRAGPPRTFTAQDLYNHIDGGAELFLEFGFARVAVQRYIHGQGEITLEAYEMTGPDSALAIFLQKCGRAPSLPGIPLRHGGDRYQIMALQGRFFLQVTNGSGDPEALPAMGALVCRLGEIIPPEATPPTPLDLLPASGRLPGSELLIRGPFGLQNLATLAEGDILGLEGKRWAAAAQYQGSAGSAATTLILVPYSEPEAAAAAFTRLADHLDPYLKPIRRGSSELVFQDYRGEFGRVELKAERLEIRLHLKSVDGM